MLILTDSPVSGYRVQHVAFPVVEVKRVRLPLPASGIPRETEFLAGRDVLRLTNVPVTVMSVLPL